MTESTEDRYRAALAHLALQLARAKLGNVSGEEVLSLAQEELRHAYELAGMPLTPQACVS